MMNRIEKVDKIFRSIADLLPMIYDDCVTDDFKTSNFMVDPNGTEILSSEQSEVEALANLFDQLYGEGTTNTGYYDPKEDERNGEVDAYTGLYYVSIA